MRWCSRLVAGKMGGMVLNEPQVWAVIGVFAAAMFGTLGLIVPLINRGTRDAINGLRGEMIGQIEGLRAEVRGEIGGINAQFAGLRHEMDSLRGEMGSLRGEMGSLRGEMETLRGEVSGLRAEMNSRFEAVGVQLTHLDRDVSFLMKREFGATD